MSTCARLQTPPAGESVLRGTVTPHYMQGWHDAPTRTVAGASRRSCPTCA